MESLWGNDFIIPTTQETAKKVLDKVNNPKAPSVQKVLKSSKMPIEMKLATITENVNSILGRYASNTVVLKTKEDFIEYINKAIDNGIIAIDTETNNSLDPISCKLMGPCLYTPGMKNAYVPVNHTDLSGNRYEWQITESDVAEQFNRLTDTKIVMHNGKFDYEVIKCTCGVALDCYWDTMIAARLLDENERAGLKQQYISKIDSSVEKYSIDHLFENVDYAIVDPEVFALYAATDSFMTYKLYEWQKEKFEQPGSERLYNLFLTVEMPVMTVAAEMELTGVCIDKEYAKRLSDKYHNKLTVIDEKISDELKKYDSKIAQWILTPAATVKPKRSTGEGFGKSKSEQLEDPINMASPTQLAIFLYDILGTQAIDKKKPRGTGEDVLTKIDLPICKLILERRGVEKLINTYIDKLPDCVSDVDGRLHAHFNQIGADTGRFSSSDPNLQNIPSHENAIRMMFVASDEVKLKDVKNLEICLSNLEEVETVSGWKNVKQLKIGDIILDDNMSWHTISDLSQQGELTAIKFKAC